MKKSPNIRSRTARATVALIGVATLFLVGCSAAGEAPTASDTETADGCTEVMKVKYQIYAGSLNNMAADVAQAKGFFGKNCLDAEAVPVKSAPDAMAQSVSGAVDFVNSAPDNLILARSNGMDIVMVANFFQRDVESLVISAKYKDELAGKSDKEVMQFLAGKKIAVTVLGGHNDIMARTNWQAASVDPSRIQFVAIGGATMLGALQNGTVDAAMLFGNLQDVAVALGAGFIYSDFRLPSSATNPVPSAVQDLGNAQGGWAAQADFVNKNKELTAAFKAANDEAVAWITDKKNRNELYTILAQAAPIPAEVPNADAVYKHSIDLMADHVVSSKMDDASVENWIAFMTGVKELSTAPKVNELVYRGK